MIDTKLLRQKILDLAIRGKLIPQNPADEPASELLKKIKAEKEALVKAGKIKKDKHESFIFQGDDKRYYEQIDGKTSDITEEIPFDIPETWEWCRIGNIMFLQAGKYIAASEIRKNETSTYRYPCYGGNGQRGFVKLFNSCGEYPLVGRQGALCGNINFAAGKFYATEHAVIVKVFSGCFPQWAAIFLKALNLNQYSTATAQPGLSVNVINTLLIPLPPVAEQQRLISQIETSFTEVDKIDKDSADLESALSLAKQKVLDLAIRGKLVPQNPADEPASELLKKINAEKETLVKAGKIKKVKHESFIFRGDDNCYYEQLNGKAVDITDEIPFEIPESWCWCRLGTLCNYGVCQSADAAEIPENAWVLDLEDIEKDTGRLLCRIYKQDRPPTSSKHVFHQGNVLYSKLRTYLNKVLVADQDGFCTSEILPLDFGRHILPDFARCVLMSKMFLDYTAQCGYGVKMPRLGTEDGRKALFPLPPLDEQKRIIAAAKQHDSILKSLQG